MTPPHPADRRFRPAPARKAPSQTALFLGIGAAVLVGVLIIVLVVVASVGAASRRAREKDGLARLQREAQRFRSEIGPETDLSNPEEAKKVDEAVERMVNAAGAVDSRMKAMIRVVMEEMIAIGKEATASSDRVVAAGGINPETLTSRDAASKRITLFEQEQATADATLQRVKNLGQTARDAASRNGLSSKEAESFIRGMNGNGRLDRLTRIREIDAELFRRFIKAVTLLRDNSGAWQVEDGRVVFSELIPGVSERYTALALEIETLSREQETLAQQISQGN